MRVKQKIRDLKTLTVRFFSIVTRTRGHISAPNGSPTPLLLLPANYPF